MSLTLQEEKKYLRLLQREDYDKCEQSLSHFVQTAWDIIEPGIPYVHNWHIDLICDYLEAVYWGQIKRLIINLPFRFSKSILVSIMFPCWSWIERPESRWIFSSYAQDLSTMLSIKRRRIIQSEWYQRRWGGKETITTDTNIKTWFANNKEGFMKATSTGGVLTGEGGNCLIIDDPLKASEITSTTKVQSSNDWFDNTFSTRLNDRKKDAIVIIMHRLGINDLTGHLLAKNFEDEFKYELLSLPMVEMQNRTITYPTSGKQLERQEGDLLWESRVDMRTIQAIKVDLGSAGFEAQCQQNPQIEGGNLVKREWWQYYRELPKYSLKFQSWDTALEAKEGNAYTVCLTAVECSNGWYITDVWRQKVESPELKRAAKQLYNRELPDEVLIEKKASGHGLIQEIRRETRMPVKGIEVNRDKVSRVNAVSPTIEAGRIFLLENASWVIDFVDEFSAFPHGAYNDQVDALTQLLIYRKQTLLEEPGSFGTLDQEVQSKTSRHFQFSGKRVF